MVWVLVSHTYNGVFGAYPLNKFELLTTVGKGSILNNKYAPQFQQGFGFRPLLNGYPSVDSFFVIGGILLGYLTFKELDKTNGFLNVPLFYLHRYMRLGYSRNGTILPMILTYVLELWGFMQLSLAFTQLYSSSLR